MFDGIQGFRLGAWRSISNEGIQQWSIGIRQIEGYGSDRPDQLYIKLRREEIDPPSIRLYSPLAEHSSSLKCVDIYVSRSANSFRLMNEYHPFQSLLPSFAFSYSFPQTLQYSSLREAQLSKNVESDEES